MVIHLARDNGFCEGRILQESFLKVPLQLKTKHHKDREIPLRITKPNRIILVPI